MRAARHRRPSEAICVLALLVLAGASACGVSGPSPAPAGAGAARGPTKLVLRLTERRIYMIHNDPKKPVESFPIAVGKKGWETPVGSFQVEEMVVHPEFLKVDPDVPTQVLKRFPPGPTNPLGERWIGFAHGKGWTIGIHGTPNPELLGQAVSHGCIRMRNEDVVRIYDRVQLGTAVTVEQ